MKNSFKIILFGPWRELITCSLLVRLIQLRCKSKGVVVNRTIRIEFSRNQSSKVWFGCLGNAQYLHWSFSSWLPSNCNNCSCNELWSMMSWSEMLVFWWYQLATFIVKDTSGQAATREKIYQRESTQEKLFE